MWLEIDRLHQRPLRIELDAGDDEEADELLAEAASVIPKEWRVRWATAADSNGPAPAELPGEWLRRTCYPLIAHFIDNNVHEAFERRIASTNRGRRGRPGNPNPFQKGLRAIFAGEHGSPNAGLQEKAGVHLWCCYIHYVPVEFLRGFGLQLGPGRVRFLSRANAYDATMRDWILDHLLRDDNSYRELLYPKELRKSLKKIKKSIRPKTKKRKTTNRGV